jgi:hypothetical protein
LRFLNFLNNYNKHYVSNYPIISADFVAGTSRCGLSGGLLMVHPAVALSGGLFMAHRAVALPGGLLLAHRAVALPVGLLMAHPTVALPGGLLIAHPAVWLPGRFVDGTSRCLATWEVC